MAQSIRISDEMYARAQTAAGMLDRSLAQQFEYWARLGAAIDASGITTSQAIELLEAGRPADVLVAIATGKGDRSGSPRIQRRNEQIEADVAAGRRSARSLLIFSSDAVQDSTVDKAPYSSQILDGAGGW